jgi:hypothetical protein
MKKKRIYKARLIYFFTCEKCHTENRQSFKVKRQRQKICRKCLHNIPDPNQMSLIPPKDEA